MRYLRPLLAAGLIATAFAVPAFAQPSSPQVATATYPECRRQPTEDQQQTGHTLYQTGKKRFDVAEYDKALALFNEAYATDCTNHQLLIIIARSWELKGNKAEAINALETYVKRAKDATDLDVQRSRIDNMKKELAAAAASASAAAAANSASASQTTAPPPPPTSTPPQPSGHTVFPYLVAGLGAVALGTGIVLYVVGTNNFPPGCANGQCTNYYDDNTPVPSTSSATMKLPICNDVNNQPVSPAPNGCAGTKKNQQRQSDAGTAAGEQTAGVIVAVAGGVLLVGGVVWHFVEPTGETKEAAGPTSNVRVTPVITPNYSGVGLSGSF